MDAIVASVLSELDVIYSFKKREKTELKAFSLLLTGFVKEFRVLLKFQS